MGSSEGHGGWNLPGSMSHCPIALTVVTREQRGIKSLIAFIESSLSLEDQQQHKQHLANKVKCNTIFLLPNAAPHLHKLFSVFSSERSDKIISVVAQSI